MVNSEGSSSRDPPSCRRSSSIHPSKRLLQPQHTCFSGAHSANSFTVDDPLRRRGVEFGSGVWFTGTPSVRILPDDWLLQVPASPAASLSEYPTSTTRPSSFAWASTQKHRECPSSNERVFPTIVRPPSVGHRMTRPSTHTHFVLAVSTVMCVVQQRSHVRAVQRRFRRFQFMHCSQERAVSPNMPGVGAPACISDLQGVQNKNLGSDGAGCQIHSSFATVSRDRAVFQS